MLQLRINGIDYPEAVGSEGSYRAYNSKLKQNVEMISGRLVEEVRGEVAIIEYSYLWFDDDLLRACLAAYRSQESVSVVYLDSESSELKSSRFIFTAFSSPSYLMEVDGKAYWTNISFTLREVSPHD